MTTGDRPRPVIFALIALLLAAAALRLYQLDAESAWLDETFSIGIARDGVDAIIYETSKDVHPPFYYFLLRGWVILFGGAVWTARLLSVVLSVSALAATFVVGRRLVGDIAALVAVSLLTVSVFQIEFAQEARMYALMTLLATISTGSFMRLFEGAERRWIVIYVVATSLMTYTHVYAAFIIAAQGATMVADVWWRRGAALAGFGRWLIAIGLVFVAFLPWLPTFTWQVSHVQAAFWIPAPVANAWFDAFRTYSGSEHLLYLMGALAALGIWTLARRPAAPPVNRSPLFFLIPWMLGPILIPFTLSFFGSSIFLPKYTIAASIPFTLIAATGLTSLPFVAIRSLVLAAALVLNLLTLPAFYNERTKDGWRDAVASLESKAETGDLVLVYPYFNDYAYSFYHQREDVTVRQFPLHGAPPPPDGWDVTMRRAAGGFDHVWFVTLASDPTAGVALEQLRARFAETDHEVVQKVALYRFERKF